MYLLRVNEHTACVSRERSKIHRSGRENCPESWLRVDARPEANGAMLFQNYCSIDRTSAMVLPEQVRVGGGRSGGSGIPLVHAAVRALEVI